MSALAVVRARVRAVAALACVEAASAWLAAAATARALAAPLGSHPDGAAALEGDGGRAAFDLVAWHVRDATCAAAIAAGALGAYALASVVLGAVLPAAMAPREPPTVRQALRAAVGRAPALVALAALAWTGYAVAALAAWGCWAAAAALVATSPDVRVADAARVAACVPAVAAAVAVRVGHDVARAELVGGGGTLGAAVRAACRRARRAPGATARAALGYASAAALATAAAVAATAGSARAGPWDVALGAARQAALVLALCARAAWAAQLTARFRANPPAPGAGDADA